MNENQNIPIILDTDIGSDIDDAVALAYLLEQPRCELLGITTVSGNVAQRCACAEIVCRAAGRDDVPIHAGASSVLLNGPGQSHVPQYAAIAHLSHRADRSRNTAIDFLRHTIRSRPGEITLVTIGPLTNVALLFAVDPEIPTLLKRLVSMAGIFFPEVGPGNDPRPREWNCMADPIATAMVYNAWPRLTATATAAAMATSHYSFGLDVTLRCTLPAAEVRQRFEAHPLLRAVIPMAEVWFAQHELMTFHDPLAAAAVFRPEVCRHERGLVQVPLSSDPDAQGQTLFAPDPAGPHRVARSVDAPLFYEELFGTFARSKAREARSTAGQRRPQPANPLAA